MPTAWHGLWYQRGMNSLLEITIDHIQTKGRCQDVLPVQQYYLFNDRINRCTRCLLFIDRHPNLLQYRESECNDADELSSVTLCPNMIAPDAPLYTLYRNNSKSQLCPIQAPFLLTNLIKDGIKCPQSSSSSSYIGECANDHQFRLHLSPCSLFHQTVDFQLTCMATWIEGFNTYFVTRLHSKHHQYACFYFNTKQKDSASTFSLSMATDDSCRSLNSKQMTTVMTLSSVYSDGIKNIDTNHSCTFPNDIQQYQWYSLNHTVQMLINNENLELINLKTNNKYQRFHCLQMIDSTNYRIRAFTNCDVKDQCLRLIRRADNVLELILTNCYDNQTSQSLIFLTKTRSISSCSISIGHLLLESIIDHHHQHHSVILRNQPKQISVGCEQREKLMIHQIDTDSRSLTQTDTCLASWQSTDPSIIYILAQSIYSNASYCLTFQMSDSIIIRNNSHECSIIHSNTNLYSAKLLNPCSQSQRVLFNRYLVLLLFYIHSKQ